LCRSAARRLGQRSHCAVPELFLAERRAQVYRSLRGFARAVGTPAGLAGRAGAGSDRGSERRRRSSPFDRLMTEAASSILRRPRNLGLVAERTARSIARALD